MSELEGEYVRFYAAGAVDAALAFVTELGATRTLAANETFYLCDLGWADSSAPTGAIFDDTAGSGNLATNETIWDFNNRASGDVNFSRPVPMHTPYIEISAQTAFKAWGHGFIRTA